ncbi:hypothetical protein [Corynebacterium ulcerans]|uniref:hypothetical protein n=1 Tax=Corynebacterium ulcerans TaxID=65058 RepID=UPI0034A534DC
MDWWSIVFGISGVISGCGGIFVAQLAYRAAKKSNSIAERALGAASEANRIAAEANHLASDANSISNRALRITSEDFEYEWAFSIDEEGICLITYYGSHDIYDVTLSAKTHHASKPISRITFQKTIHCMSMGEQFVFDFQSVFPELVTDARKQQELFRACSTEDFTPEGRDVLKFNAIIVLNWQASSGRKFGRSIQYSLSCRENKDGVIEFALIT